MNERVLKRIVSADALAACLVLLALQVLLYGVERAVRDAEIHNLFWICLLAAAIGFRTALRSWSAKHSTALIIVLGIITFWMVGARVSVPLADLIRSFFTSGVQVFPNISYRFDVDATSMTASWNVVNASSTALLARFQTELASIESFRIKDVLIRNMLWMFLLWLLAAWIGWFAGKRNGMVSLLPGVILLTFLTWSTERRVESLWGLVMIMLLLMGIWNYRQHVHDWEANHIDYSDSIRLDVGQFTLMIIVVVGLISYITPSISWEDIRDYLRERERTQQSDAVARPSSSTNTTTSSSKLVPGSSLPREHLLTAGAAQSEEIVMTIKTGELSPIPVQGTTIRVPRYYWRSLIYDQYDGRGWYTTSASTQSISADQPLIAGLLTGYKSLHLDIQMRQPDGKLYWSGMLYSAGIPISVDWRFRPAASLFADQTTLLQGDIFAARTNATAYTVDALVPTPSIEQLRAAPAEGYPDQIQYRYLSLPDSIPERVHRLAREITEGKTTQYDKATAIEAYLRSNYPYDLEISAPPEDQDVADYFLFDLKRGYCDYYATAMVVLARSSGLPARFVSGYASGDYDASTAEYVVRDLHAHSWPEVYFPEIGWVEFEPTGNQPEIERAAATKQLSETSASQFIERNISLGLTYWKTFLLFLSLLIICIAVIAWIEPLFLLRLAPAVAIEVLYRRFYRIARPLAGEAARAETAHEFTHKLIQRIQGIDAAFPSSSYLLQEDIDDLASIYQGSLFSDHRIERQDIKRALMKWNRLRWALAKERIKYFFWLRNKTSRSSF